MAQLTDTHVVAPGTRHYGTDTGTHLADAVAALNALERRADCVVVTGDLVNDGVEAEYERFRNIVSTLAVPYFVIPGNHDDRERMRQSLPEETFGGSRDRHIRYAVDIGDGRIVGIDGNEPRPWPGAWLSRETLNWLESTLAQSPPRPTILCVHQPPFRTGLHYLDAFGFIGARRLRAIVRRNPHVGRVISGHIHCVRQRLWGNALACTGPSTAPQTIPLLFMDGKLAGTRREAPGFALHEWSARAGFTTVIYRRTARGRFVPQNSQTPEAPD